MENNNGHDPPEKKPLVVGDPTFEHYGNWVHLLTTNVLLLLLWTAADSPACNMMSLAVSWYESTRSIAPHMVLVPITEISRMYMLRNLCGCEFFSISGLECHHSLLRHSIRLNIIASLEILHWSIWFSCTKYLWKRTHFNQDEIINGIFFLLRLSESRHP